jgi:hypothetical protein
LSAGIFFLSAAPAAGWYVYVQQNTAGHSYRPTLMSFSTFLGAVLHPPHYAIAIPFAALVRFADYVAIAGALIGFGCAFILLARHPIDPVRIAAILFTLLGLLVDLPAQWSTVYNFGRYDAPLLVCLAGAAAQTRNPWLLSPIAMLLPRIAIQLAPQALGIVHWIM